MNESPAQPTLKHKRRWLRVVLGVLLLLVVAYASYRYILHRRVQSRLHAIRAQGYPLTLEELDKWFYTAAPSENAFPTLTNAFAHFSVIAPDRENKSLPIFGKANLPEQGEPITPEMRRSIAELLERNSQMLGLLREVATIGYCRFPVRKAEYGLGSITELHNIRQAVRLFLLETAFHADADDLDLATESLVTLMALSRLPMNHPGIVSLLGAVACERIGISGLERVLNSGNVSAGSLDRLSVAFSEGENRNLHRQFVAIRCSGILTFDAFRETKLGLFVSKDEQFGIELVEGLMDDMPPSHGWALLWHRASGRLDLDEACFLDMIDKFIKTAQLPLVEGLPAIEELARGVDALPKTRPGARMILAGLDNVSIHEAAIVAYLRLCQTALTMEKAESHGQSLSASRGEPTPSQLFELPIDPFSGQAIRYRKLEKGYSLYSVGKDRVDDGGDERKDITFTVER